VIEQGFLSKLSEEVPCQNFSIAKHISWAETRHATSKEDRDYSLLGVFDVYMSLISGEGGEKAIKTALRGD
jgi:hypothetical protein